MRAFENRRVRILDHGPNRLKLWPKHLASRTFVTFSAQPGHCKVAHVVKGTEERREEHYLRENEPSHTPDVGTLELIAVHPGMVFTNNYTEPLVQYEGQQQKACQSYQGRERRAFRSPNIVENIAQTKNGQEQPDRREKR